MAKNNLGLLIPSQKLLESRFSFIENEILKENITIYFRYIIFLLSLEEEYELPGAISYSLYKDIIFHTAAIIESCLHYCIKLYLAKRKIKSANIMPTEYEDTVNKQWHKISNNKRICGIVRKRKIRNFTDKTQFIEVNRAAKRAKLLNNTLFKKAEKLRKMRNKIHLASLNEVDDYYEKKEIQVVFKDAKQIIENLQIKIEDIS